MKAMALVVDERGASLEIGNHDVVVLRHADSRCERVGLRALSNVVLNGDVTLISDDDPAHDTYLQANQSKTGILPRGLRVKLLPAVVFRAR